MIVDEFINYIKEQKNNGNNDNDDNIDQNIADIRYEYIDNITIQCLFNLKCNISKTLFITNQSGSETFKLLIGLGFNIVNFRESSSDINKNECIYSNKYECIYHLKVDEYETNVPINKLSLPLYSDLIKQYNSSLPENRCIKINSIEVYKTIISQYKYDINCIHIIRKYCMDELFIIDYLLNKNLFYYIEIDRDTLQTYDNINIPSIEEFKPEKIYIISEIKNRYINYNDLIYDMIIKYIL